MKNIAQHIETVKAFFNGKGININSVDVYNKYAGAVKGERFFGRFEVNLVYTNADEDSENLRVIIDRNAPGEDDEFCVNPERLLYVLEEAYKAGKWDVTCLNAADATGEYTTKAFQAAAKYLSDGYVEFSDLTVCEEIIYHAGCITERNWIVKSGEQEHKFRMELEGEGLFSEPKLAVGALILDFDLLHQLPSYIASALGRSEAL